MVSMEEIDKVLAAIGEEDPDHADEQLEAMNDALRFAAGYSGETAEQFIDMYVAGE